ncbi:hypothetical protein C8Q72DRAFT_794747 [Fomitopsis betulina]|nr:hypothetical protein C8Q72DRAFT_794747 [Fomitopsis betulina]
MSGHPTGLAAVAMSMSDTWDRQFRIPDSICPDFDLAKPVPRVGIFRGPPEPHERQARDNVQDDLRLASYGRVVRRWDTHNGDYANPPPPILPVRYTPPKDSSPAATRECQAHTGGPGQGLTSMDHSEHDDRDDNWASRATREIVPQFRNRPDGTDFSTGKQSLSLLSQLQMGDPPGEAKRGWRWPHARPCYAGLALSLYAESLAAAHSTSRGALLIPPPSPTDSNWLLS